ncbi:MAG: CcmD family protein [Armatimonadota bacterium]|jgi:CcmD family protein|nr:CcmD family protein [Armatimonadota bacterium]
MQPLHSVMLAALAVWAGLFLYLWRLDARLRAAEERLARKADPEAAEAPEGVLEAGPAGEDHAAETKGAP